MYVFETSVRARNIVALFGTQILGSRPGHWMKVVPNVNPYLFEFPPAFE